MESFIRKVCITVGMDVCKMEERMGEHGFAKKNHQLYDKIHKLN